MPTMQTVLRLNAASCLVFGAAFLAFPEPIAGFLGAPPAPAWLIAALGAGLIGYSLPLLVQSRRGRPGPVWLRIFALGDGLWVLVTIGLVLAGLWITHPPGIAAALAVAAMVGAFGWLQLRQARSLQPAQA